MLTSEKAHSSKLTLEARQISSDWVKDIYGDIEKLEEDIEEILRRIDGYFKPGKPV